jgi:hypothetical protein
MVSPKITAEIKQSYENLAKQSLDPHNYTDFLFQVVFEIITADTFIAGIASKILDCEPVTLEERAIIRSQLMVERRWWRCDNGQLFDVQEYPEIYQAALNIERLREQCEKALNPI